MQDFFFLKITFSLFLSFHLYSFSTKCFFFFLDASYDCVFASGEVIYYFDWHSGQIKKPKALCVSEVNGKCLMIIGDVFLFALHVPVLFYDQDWVFLFL